MSSSTTTSTQAEFVDYRRLWWVALLALIAAVAANILTRLIAGLLFPIAPEFGPLSYGPFIFFTIMGMIGAVVVYALIGRFAKRPIWLFRIVAVVVFILSLLPTAGLLTGNAFPGTTTPSVLTLMVMHLWAALIAVGLLTTMARKG